MKRAWPRVLLAGFLLTFVLQGVAFAHVTVSPEKVDPGTNHTFTVEVPTEKHIPTTGVGLGIPKGFEVFGVRSPPGGWRGVADDDSVTWSGGEIGTSGMEITSPEGEVISLGESQESTFEARTPETPGAYAWPVSQTYEDGSVVEWAGPADSEEPAPVVEVAASGPETTAPEGAGHHEHGEGAADHEHGTGGQQNAATPTEGGPVSAYVLVGIGVLVACVATATPAVLRARAGPSGTTGRHPRP